METQPRYTCRKGPAVGPGEKAQVLGIIQNHRGARNAITSRALSRATGHSTRKVREAIAQLVESGELIGASVEGVNGGYYMITTADELEATRNTLRSRAKEIFARDAALVRAWRNVHGVELQPLLPTFGRAA